MAKRFFWFAGERYLAVTKKQQIIRKAGSQWGVRNLSTTPDIDTFASELASRDLFGPSKRIYVYDGDLPKPAEIAAGLIEKIKEPHRFVLITPSAKKNTKLYKQFGKYLETFEPLKSGSWVNNAALTRGKKIMKNLVDWEGSPGIIDYVLEMTDYDYGASVNEIEKIRIYTSKEDSEISKSDCAEIICNSDREDITKLIECINFKRAKEAFETWDKLYNIHSANAISIYALLLENFRMMLYCRMAFDEGLRKANDIGSYVASIWEKKTGKVNPGSMAFRYRLYSKAIQARSVEEICSVIYFLEDCLKKCLFEKADEDFIVQRMIFRCMGRAKFE